MTPPRPATSLLHQDARDACADLARFVCQTSYAGLTEEVLHEAKRLLLLQISASASVAAQAEGQQWLHWLATTTRSALPQEIHAGMWWTDTRVQVDTAVTINQQLCRQHPPTASHLPTQHPLHPDLIPRVLTLSDAEDMDGRTLLQAIAVGTEVELAWATAQREAMGDARPQLTMTRLGAVAAVCHLRGLDIGPCTEALLDATEGETHWLQAMGRVLPQPGQRWRIMDVALHCRPVTLLALGPVEAALMLRAELPHTPDQRLVLSISSRAWQWLTQDDAQESFNTYGVTLRQTLATAWHLAQYSLDERRDVVRADPVIQDLESRIAVVMDPALTNPDACTLKVYDAHGLIREMHLPSALGSPQSPLSDGQLSEVFRQSAEDLVLPRRAGEILYALWGLDGAADPRTLVSLLGRSG